MAELNPRDRLQPFLLDRLTDDQPENTQESRDRRVFSPRQVQASVLRDLAWLLNSRAHRADDGLAEFPEVERSVINFGIPDLAGLCLSSIEPVQLERVVVQALKNFEPRFVPQTLQVRLLNQADQPGQTNNVISFEIRGELRANPLTEPLFVKTAIDLETGQFVLKDR
jgi:type VI secretion system protein ImpF